jgi:hypothetical protein
MRETFSAAEAIDVQAIQEINAVTQMEGRVPRGRFTGNFLKTS